VKVELRPVLMDVPTGSYYVGLDQPLSGLVLAAMEPDAQSSYFGGGIVRDVAQEARVTLPPNLKLVPVP
jgi:hypothetical protein